MKNAKVVEKEMQDEMVGILTAISIVSKRLANRLSQLEPKNESQSSPKGEKKTNETSIHMFTL